MIKTLIADRSNAFRQSLKELLQFRFPSMIFEEADGTDEAWEKISDFQPDIVFMDINLPVKIGLEFINKLNRTYSKLRIIVITDADSAEYREVIVHKGAHYFLSKFSTTPEDIVRLVISILPDSENVGDWN